MKGVQFLLIIGTAFIGSYFFVQLRKRALDILLFALLLATAIVFILWPDLTNVIAGKLGVGRGADLIFYMAVLIFWFIVLKLFARIRKLETAITELVRQDALRNASPLINKNCPDLSHDK